MTNTTGYISNYDKVSALVEVEAVGFYQGEVSDAMRAGVAEGFLVAWVSESGQVAVRLTTAGRERLAGFRALLA